MRVLIIGISQEGPYNLAPAILKAYALKDRFIKKHTAFELRWFLTDCQDSTISKEILRLSPAILGFSCYVWNIDKVLRIITLIRKKGFPGKIILGGPEVSPVARKILTENPLIDIIVRGEGERTFSEIIKRLLQKKPLSPTRGITLREDSEIIETPDRPLIADLKTIPSPYLTNVVDLNQVGHRLLGFETFRGCAFKCTYCQWGQIRPRYFPLSRIKKELLLILRSKIKRVWVADGTCNLNKERFKEILRTIIRHNSRGVIFDFEMKAELLDEETIDLLAQLRGGYLALGLQSTSTTVLKNIRRTWNQELFEKNIALLKKKAPKIEIRIDLISGLPGDTYQSHKESLIYAASLGPHQVQSHTLQLFPGTPLHNSANTYGIKFLPGPPYSFIESKTFSVDDCHKIAALRNLLADPAIHIVIIQLSRQLHLPFAEIFSKLLKQESPDEDPRKIELRSLLSRLPRLAKILLSQHGARADVSAPLLELAEYMHLKRTKTFLRNAANTKARKFEYAVHQFAEKALFYRDLDIKTIKKSPMIFVYSDGS